MNDHEGQVSSENCYMGEKNKYPQDLSHCIWGTLYYRHLIFSLTIIGVLKKSIAQSIPDAMTKAENSVQERQKVGKLEKVEEAPWERAPLH